LAYIYAMIMDIRQARLPAVEVDTNYDVTALPESSRAVPAAAPAVAVAQPAVVIAPPAVAQAQPAVVQAQPAVAQAQPAVAQVQPLVRLMTIDDLRGQGLHGPRPVLLAPPRPGVAAPIFNGFRGNSRGIQAGRFIIDSAASINIPNIGNGADDEAERIRNAQWRGGYNR
jgi:hypothetical protein